MLQVAILTGDLIGSTEAPPEATEAALAVIASAPASQRFTRFRGDGWQIATEASLGPRLALTVLARLRAAGGVESRIAVGLGAVEDWGLPGDLSQARGPALTLSGRALDAMTGLLALSEDPPDPRNLALVRLWEAQARRWSPQQAEALALALQGLRQTEIAARLRISPQAVSLRLKGADAAALTESLTLWETAMESP